MHDAADARTRCQPAAPAAPAPAPQALFSLAVYASRPGHAALQIDAEIVFHHNKGVARFAVVWDDVAGREWARYVRPKVIAFCEALVKRALGAAAAAAASPLASGPASSPRRAAARAAGAPPPDLDLNSPTIRPGKVVRKTTTGRAGIAREVRVHADGREEWRVDWDGAAGVRAEWSSADSLQVDLWKAGAPQVPPDRVGQRVFVARTSNKTKAVYGFFGVVESYAADISAVRFKLGSGEAVVKVANSHLVAIDAARPRTVAAAEGVIRVAALGDLLEAHKAHKLKDDVTYVGDDEAQVLNKKKKSVKM